MANVLPLRSSLNGVEISSDTLFGLVTGPVAFDPLDLVPAAVYVCDAVGRIQRFNLRAAELWGREPLINNDDERFCGSLRMYRLDGGPLPHDQCPMADVLRTGVSVRDQEVVIEHPNGSRHVALVNIDALKGDTGAIVGAINCFIDITDRKRAEHEQTQARLEIEALTLKLAKERDQSRTILDALPTAIYTTDAEGRITYFNQAAETLWGCQPELGTSEFCGSWKLYQPDGTPLRHDQCPMARALKEQRPIRNEEAIAEQPDGTMVPFVPYPTPLFDEHGKLTGAVNMLVEISERKQLENIRQRFAAIVQFSQDAIISKDLNGIISSWNAGAEAIFGYSAEETIGQSIIMLIPPDRRDEEESILRRLKRGERIEHYETVRQRKDGRLVHVSLCVSPLYDASGKVIGASKIARDITERKEAQERQQLLSHELQHRTRNLFAVVQSVVARSFDGKRNVREAKAAALSRLHSLAQTHDMLIGNDWAGASLAEVVSAETRPYADRMSVSGPDIALNARAAQNFALSVHELATNAAKHGALSDESGRVTVRWSIVDLGDEKDFRFEWHEEGGPPVRKPRKNGFGSTVITQVMAEHAHSRPVMHFAREGLHYELSGPLDAIVRREPAEA